MLHSFTKAAAFALPLVAMLALGAPSAAQIDDLVLSTSPADPSPGNSILFHVDGGTPGDFVGILVSTDPGPTNFPIIGLMNVGLANFDLWNAGQFDASGRATFDCGATCDAVNIPFYTQAFSLRPNPLRLAGKSNPLIVVIDDSNIEDCNENGIDDDCDIEDGTSQDSNGNGIPDECELGEIGDTVFCDLDDDGVQDPGEPGIEGVVVNLTCAGPDGMFGTPDDLFDSQVTDANGNYLFLDVPPGACEVDVDVTTVPLDKVPGVCSTVVSVDLQLGEAFLDADFCFVSVCIVDGSIGSNFNGTAIDAGNYLWFNSVVKITGLPPAPVTACLLNQRIEFTAGGVFYSLPAPDTSITISDTATSASTTYDAASNTWVTVVPEGYSGNIFLGGLAFQVPTDFPGGISPVTWSGDFKSPAFTTSFQWKWAAAVYTTFSTDLNAVGVKPIDGSQQNPYSNSDKAGTPESFKSFVVGGARGGGGSNFTGSYSSTRTEDCPDSATAGSVQPQGSAGGESRR